MRISFLYKSRDMTKSTKWLCVQGRLRSAWASAWRNLGSSATHWAHSEDWSDQADAQADLSLRWAHTHFVGFIMPWLIYCSSQFPDLLVRSLVIVPGKKCFYLLHISDYFYLPPEIVRHLFERLGCNRFAVSVSSVIPFTVWIWVTKWLKFTVKSSCAELKLRNN